MKASIISIFIISLIISACSKADKASSVSETGKGGSLAKFTIAGNFLYVVDGTMMHVYNIENPVTMRAAPDVNIGFEAETIFPYDDKLFIGSRDGMFIYSLANPSNPEKLGEARHLRSCDPYERKPYVYYSAYQLIKYYLYHYQH